jgi:type II secretory pathway component GspD/PulD (secretin)
MTLFLSIALLWLAQPLPVTRLAGGVDGQASGQPPPRLAQPGLPVTRLETGAGSLDSPRRLSLAFAEPRPIEEVLALLVAGTPFSIAIDSNVEGSFRGELKDLTLREALSTLLDPLGLDYLVRGTVIRVTRHRTEMRQFDVNLLAVQRGLARTTGAEGGLLSSTVPAEDVFASIAVGVRSLLSPDGRAHVDRRAGLVQVTDYPERLDRVAIYLEALQLRSGRQVRLEARVLEVTLRSAAAIDWRAVREKLGLPNDIPQAGLAADPSALQAALGEQGDVRVLSAPDVTAMNNEPALVRMVTPGVSSLTMTVVPQIAADGIVQLSVSHALEERIGSGATSAVETDTVARVANGSTVMVGGLIRSVPATGSGRSRTPPSRAELVVLLRANIVAP